MKNILEADSILLEIESKRILQSVYIKSETGKITGLLGRNGTGKSSLMKIIFGELDSRDKSVRINGRPIYGSNRLSADMHYLPQCDLIPKSFSVQRVFKDFDLDFTDFLNFFPDFEKYYNSMLKYLSGGERRIVEIYVILVSKSKFCMLDEPFSQVMPLHVETVKKLILNESANKGIILTDHLYTNIVDIADYLYVINEGKVYLTSDTQDLESLGYARISR